MIAHNLFLVVFVLDLTIIPFLAFLDLGIAANISSNYMARYSYLLAFSVASIHVILLKRKMVFNSFVIVFFLVFVIGALKGVLQGNMNSAFLSHVYYVMMPVIMLSYGWLFMGVYQRSDKLRNNFSKVMYISYYFGVVIILAFILAYQWGLAKYDAIGLWNLIFSGPYLLYQQHGTIYFGLSLLLTLLSGKRGAMVVFSLYLVIYFFIIKKTKISNISILLAGIIFLVSFFVIQEMAAFDRVYRSIVAFQEGDYDMVFAMRWSESISAIAYLNDRFDHWLIGAGFGAQFLPWPDLPDYEKYLSHYTHFSIISYILFGGVIFAFYIYLVLIGQGISLVRKIRLGLVNKEYYHFLYWLLGILVGSLSGADLMNNPYLWFIIGCCFHLNRRYSSL